jgi:hypothetical protein
MLFVEVMFVIQEIQLPIWFFPQMTVHELISYCHLLYPSIMHGSRIILAVLQSDRKKTREIVLEQLSASVLQIQGKIEQVSRSAIDCMETFESYRYPTENSNNNNSGGSNSVGEDSSESITAMLSTQIDASMESILEKISTEYNENQVQTMKLDMNQRLQLVYTAIQKQPSDGRTWILLRNLGIYLVVRYLFAQWMMKSNGTTSN